MQKENNEPRILDDEPSDVLSALFRYRRSIVVIVLISSLVGLYMAWSAQKLSRAFGSILVEVTSSSALPTESSNRKIVGRINAATESKVINSRSIIGETVGLLDLDLIVIPKYYPFIGATMARKHNAALGPAEPFLGLQEYAWGGEKVTIERLEIPHKLRGALFTLITKEDNRYELRLGESKALLEGRVGETVTQSIPQGKITVAISELRAREETQFYIGRAKPESVISAWQKKIYVEEVSKSSGVLEITLFEPDPELATNFVNTLSRAYVQNHREILSNRASERIQFIDEQLPVLRAELDRTERELREHRQLIGSVDFEQEKTIAVDRLQAIDRQITRAEQQKVELLQIYTREHPQLQRWERSYENLLRQRAEIQERVLEIPKTEAELFRLQSNRALAKNLYDAFLVRLQELKVLVDESSQNVRILDPAAVEIDPPRSIEKLAIAFLIGLVLGMAQALARYRLDRGIRDGSDLESALRVSPLVDIPHSRLQQRNRRRKGYLLSEESPNDLAVESLRALRSNLSLVQADADNNVILITGVSPGGGKSFVSANLACVMAEPGQRILLIDADLHKGHAHKKFNVESSPGLINVLAGECSLEDAIQPTEIENIDVLAIGDRRLGSSELFLTPLLRQTVAEASSRYNHVIVDTAPILALNDAAVLSLHMGTNLIIARAAENSPDQVQMALEHMRKAGSQNLHIVLNAVQYGADLYGRYPHAYRYA